MAAHDAKLNPEKVREIRKLLAEGVPNVVLANKYGVSRQVITDVKSRRIWKKVQ